ncbi:acyl carrier protein, mitochondrial-like [Paramacrobiotus metropolitanus]|uniref:acyl carrier protein, mitochondrial-like n=1 Tax=Paramacrobiotus metropolitanus TaxID=2943436 RepID=UPI0024465A09|nr:acyl carrier protein, mitochondrial-like [Paramacrobiotus metropolitanus]
MPAAALQRQPRRHMARPTYTRAFFMDVIMLNLRLFDKIDPNKLTLDSHFHKDLGLDSLDHVEIIMAVEDEYSFEIPDSDAQKLLTPRAIVNYLCDKYEIYENIHNWDKDGPTKPKVEECAPEDPWEKSGKKGAAH